MYYKIGDLFAPEWLQSLLWYWRFIFVHSFCDQGVWGQIHQSGIATLVSTIITIINVIIATGILTSTCSSAFTWILKIITIIIIIIAIDISIKWGSPHSIRPINIWVQKLETVGVEPLS